MSAHDPAGPSLQLGSMSLDKAMPATEEQRASVAQMVHRRALSVADRIMLLEALGLARTDDSAAATSRTPAYRPRKITAEQVRGIVDRYQAGAATVADLAAEHGVAVSAIQYHLSKHGAKRTPGGVA